MWTEGLSTADRPQKKKTDRQAEAEAERDRKRGEGGGGGGGGEGAKEREGERLTAVGKIEYIDYPKSYLTLPLLIMQIFAR